MNKKTYVGIVLLIGILMLALFFRLYRLPERLWWGGDMGRDLLVATHISVYHEFPLLGHTATGFEKNTVFYYPPYWYYFLSVFRTFTSNPTDIAAILVLLQMILILLFYKTGSVIGDRYANIIVAFLYAVCSKLWEINSNIWPVIIAPLFFFPGLYMLLYTKKRKSQLLGYGLMIFSTTIHYSAAAMLAVLLIYEIIEDISKQRWKKVGFTLIYITIITTTLYLPLFPFIHTKSLVTYLTSRHLVDLSVISMSRFSFILQDIWQNLFDKNSFYANVGFGILVINTILALSSKRIRHITRSIPIVVAALLYIIILFIKPVPDWNYTLLYPLLILISGVIFDYVIGHQNMFVRVIGIFSTLAFAWLLFNNGSNLRNCCSDDIGKTKYIINTVNAHASANNIKNFIIMADERLSGWRHEEFTYWYFIESPNNKFLRIKNINNNLELLLKPSDFIYLICINKNDNYTPECNDSFSKMYKEYTMDNSLSFSIDNKDIFVYAPNALITSGDRN